MGKKISVALAAFRGERFIAEQVGSIIRQSIPPSEIVICDDSGPDSPVFRALRPLLEEYPELIRYHLNAERLGVDRNFEKAIGLTSGDIILLADQDDVWAPEKIRMLVGLIGDNPIGAFCDSELVGEDLSPLGSTHWGLREFHPDDFARYRAADPLGKLAFFCRRVPAAGHNMGFAAVLKDVILPLPELPGCHDTWIGLVVAATGFWQAADLPLTKFRQHRDNVSEAGRRGPWSEAVRSLRGDTCGWYAALYDQLIERLKKVRPETPPEVLALLADRRDHSAARSRMTGGFFDRLPLVLGELVNRRYFKYGRGWKNVIQDLALRSFVRGGAADETRGG